MTDITQEPPISSFSNRLESVQHSAALAVTTGVIKVLREKFRKELGLE